MILCYIAYILYNKKTTFKKISKTLLKNLLFFIIFKYYIISFSHMILSFTWGLGIGDWAQPPIPNPQSPIPMQFLI